MRTTGIGPTFGVLVGRALGLLVLAGAVNAAAARIPQPVSPGSPSAGAVAEARCPTFSWAGVPSARGYQIAVFRVAAAPGELVLVTRASLPQNAQTWTPPVSQCLERGQRYAWSVAATAGDSEADHEVGDAPDTLDWAPAFLFEVEAAPSMDELEQAMATIERYRAHGIVDRPVLPGRAGVERLDEAAPTRPALEPRPTSAGARDGDPNDALPGALIAPSSSITRIASEANTPTLGTPSLTVSANISLSAASNLFKNDVVFLWDDTDGNTALGREALASVAGSATNNTAVGRQALQNTTGGGSSHLGSYNTAIGDGALSENTTGFANTASGYKSLSNNTTGFSNTATGHRALYQSSIGDRNTATGTLVLYANSTGSYNTASGYSALRSNTTGHRNTASGAYALRANITGNRNTASGAFALRANTTGNRNTASGAFALRSNSTGTYNTASGVYALYDNTDGSYNVASGSRALRFNTTGHHNTANGHLALYSNTTGYNNTSSGDSALRSNTTGHSNTASGNRALFSNTDGFRNTASGYRALNNNTTGDRNIALGRRAGYFNAGGSNGIFIGNEGTTLGSSTIWIGTQYTHDATYIAGIRDVTTTAADAIPVLVSSTGQLGTASSSRSLKQDIQDVGPLADRLLDLRPVAFRYRQHSEADPETPLQFGLIAEEVAEVFPELVVYDRNGKPQTVKYHLLSSLLLGELQRQDQRAETRTSALTSALAEQERLVVIQQAELRRLAARLEALESRAPRATRKPEGGERRGSGRR